LSLGEPTMILIRWVFRMIGDIVLFGAVNKSYAMSFALLAFLIIGLTIVAAQVSAPFIYTLF
jgi:hypothetical protein